MQFSTRVEAAHFDDATGLWTITTADGTATTCRYFIPATGCLSIPRKPSFPGLSSYKGEWYQPSNWPKHNIDFSGKRVAIVGTGSTGVHLVPRLAHVAKELTVFQRTPNYVLPVRNRIIDEYEAADVVNNLDATWEKARAHPGGHPLGFSGRTVKGTENPDTRRQVFDFGWERGCFEFSFETFDDALMDLAANEHTSDFIRGKIRSIVQDPKTAELLTPKYPLGAKRPPAGSFYYEAFNRPNVHLVDMSNDAIDLYENGIRMTSSGAEHEFDIIIFALGFDSGSGALSQMRITNSQGKSLNEYWEERLQTYAGVLISGFPNMFMVCNFHFPLGNLPTMLETAIKWIRKTINYMEENKLATINVSQKAVETWCDHAEELWKGSPLAAHAEQQRSWFCGGNMVERPPKVMFYFGGLPNWRSWLDEEANSGWGAMEFGSPRVLAASNGHHSTGSLDIGGVSVTSEMLESAVLPLQVGHGEMSPVDKFNLGSAACARYIDWAVKDVNDRGLAVKQDYRVHWWKVMRDFVKSESGQALVQQAPKTKEELDELTSKLGVEGEAISKIGPEIARMLTDETKPLFHMLKDDLLFRMYLSDEGARPNQYAADFTKLLTSKRKDLRILEVGAGTGGTTFRVLSACSPDGERFCSEYMYTDISKGFFKTGETTLKKWASLLTFKTLDIEGDAAKQGFLSHSYDLILAANVVHATKTLSKSLETIHKLLKPGGVLALVEVTQLTPYFNIAFGPLPGWWLGVDEGRTESPLQSADQWSKQLLAAGFSGVDLAAYDFPEPDRHSALLLSTSLAVETKASELMLPFL